MLAVRSKKNMKKEEFIQGIKDGLPIGMGYFPVSVSFGMTAVLLGVPVWQTILISFTNLTSAGQFAGVKILVAGGTFVELVLTLIIIEIRYFLMSLSVSQKLDPSVTFKQRLFIAYDVTDENYAMAMSKKGSLKFPYMLGMIIVCIFGWTSGTIVGAIAGELLPKKISIALGIALYGMFIAIIIPPAKHNKGIFFTVLFSIILSVTIYYVPFLHFISEGWSIIVVTTIVASLMAYLRPIKTGDDE